MKLHLPKQLLTTLLTAIAFAATTPFTQAAQYTGTFGWAASDDASTTDVNESVLRFNFADASGLSVTALSSDKSYKSTNEGAATNAFTPNQNIGNGAGNNWTLNFTYTFEDTDVASATLNSITFDAFLFNGGGNPQNADSYARPVKFTLTQDSTTVAEETVAYANCGSEWDNDAVLETTGVTLIGEGTESTTKTYALTASNAQVDTTYGTFVGLRSMTFDITATIKSGADVTWTNGADATWSGESWKTEAGTIGTMADATVGAASFTGVTNEDGSINDYTVTVDAAATAGSIAVSSGNYTFNAANNGGSLSITGANVAENEYSLSVAEGASATFNVATTLAGTVSNAGTLTFGSNLTVADGTSLSGNIIFNDTVTSNGTLSFTSDASATFNVATTLAGTVSNAGTLTFGSNLMVATDTSLSLSGTVIFKDTIYNTGTLSLADGTEIRLDELQNYDIKTDGGNTYALYDSEGNLTTNDDGNGFTRIKSSEYWLVKGNSDIEGLDMEREFSHVDGETTYKLYEDTDGVYFSSGDYTVYDLFSITTGTVDVNAVVQAKASAYALKGGRMNITEGSVNTSQIDYTSGTATLSSGARLIIDSADETQTATHWLTNTTGEAGSVIEIAANANFGEVSDSPRPYVTAFEGKWVVTKGATLKLGGLDDGWSRDYSVALQKLEALELDGGNLRYFGGSSTLGVVNVKQAGELTVYEMYDDDKLLTINELNLSANLTLSTNWRSRLDIESLSGAGNLIIGGGRSDGNGVVVNVNAANDFTGYLDINCGAHAKDAVNISTDDNAKVNINADSASTINKLTLADGATLNYLTQHEAYEYTIKEVEVSGDATISMCPIATWWQGAVHIESLTSAVDENNAALSGTLTLKSNFRNSERGVFNLKGGKYYGTISFEGESGSSGDRNHVLNIKSGAVAADAVINVKGNENSIMSLGIGDATVTSVTVKGLTGIGTIYSGEQVYGGGTALASDGTQRTLIIDTDGSGTFTNAVTTADYSSSATIKDGLNLEKQGLGSQTFSGNVSAFNGSLNVLGGTLAFTNSGNLDITTATVATDAGLTLGGVTTVGTMSSAGTVTLNSGASLALAAGTAEAQKEHSIGTLTTAAGAGISLGDNATLTLNNTLDAKTAPNSGNTGNADTEASLDLTITGGEGSKLFISLDNSETAQNWQSNNTVRLTALAGDKTVSEVHVSGALAAGVYGGDLKTDLGGAKLVLADESTLVVRKDGTYDFGADAIELEGSTTVKLYGGVTAAGAVISNDISGSKLVAGTGTEGGVTFTGAVELEELVVNVASEKKVVLNGDSEKKLQKLTVNSGKTLEIANGSTLQMTDAEGNTKVSISGIGSSAATLTAKSDSALAQLQEDASFTIQDMTLTNTTITAATPTTKVNFSNVTVAGATVLQNLQASMTNANVAAGGSESTAGTFSATTSLLSGITLANTDTAGSTITVDLGDLSCVAPMGPGKYDLSITLSGFTMQDYTQGIEFSGWLGELIGASSGVKVSFSEAVAEETPAAVAEGGAATGVTYSTGSVGTVITITGLNVPEPASATLGLAALMMLCARRRRKA